MSSRTNPSRKSPPKPGWVRGKVRVEKWVAVIKPGTMLFEVAGCSATAAREALRLADTKLPFHCRFVSRDEEV